MTAPEEINTDMLSFWNGKGYWLPKRSTGL